MIYIQDVRDRIEKLAPAWEKGTLSQEELRELYSLFDEVVREARRTRSCSVDNAHSPENYLLVVFENRIESTVFKFLREKIKMGIELEEAGGKKPLYETSTFKEWMHYGRQLTLTIILGDATERQDRRKAVGPFLRKFESSEEKHLTLNYKPIKASFDAHLGVTGTHKDPDFLPKLMRPKALSKAEVELKKFSEEKKRGPFLDGFIGPGFIIKDASAIEAASRLARQKGIGYDPDYKRKNLKDLTFKKALAMKALRAWQRGENHHEFRTEKEVNEWIKNRLVGESLNDINAQIQSIRKRNPNIVNFLFGSKAPQATQSGKLYYRLMDLWKLKEKIRRYNRNVSEGLSREEEEKLRREIGEIPKGPKKFAKGKDNHDPVESKGLPPQFWEAAKPFLTKKQQIVLQMRHIERRPISEIAKTLNKHPRTIYKHLSNIEKTLAENVDQLKRIRLTLQKDLSK